MDEHDTCRSPLLSASSTGPHFHSTENQSDGGGGGGGSYQSGSSSVRASSDDASFFFKSARLLGDKESPVLLAGGGERAVSRWCGHRLANLCLLVGAVLLVLALWDVGTGAERLRKEERTDQSGGVGITWPSVSSSAAGDDDIIIYDDFEVAASSSASSSSSSSSASVSDSAAGAEMVSAWASSEANPLFDDAPPAIIFFLIDDLGWHDIGCKHYYNARALALRSSVVVVVCLCTLLDLFLFACLACHSDLPAVYLCQQ